MDDMVRVDVIDQGAVPPDLTAPRGLGLGLPIVTALADVFGADGPDWWFAIRTGRAMTGTAQPATTPRRPAAVPAGHPATDPYSAAGERP